jgi:putative hemolysin
VISATALLLLGLLASVVLSGFFSGWETGTYCLNRVRLRVASDQNRPGAGRLAALMQQPENLVITALLGTNVADYLATASASALLLRAAVPDGLTEVYATLIVTPLILVFGGIIPKDWFRRECDRLMYPLAVAVSVCLAVVRATGLLWLLRRFTHKLIRWIDPQHLEREEQVLPRARTLSLLREGAAGGGLTVLQRDLMDRVMNISKTPVASVMIPRERAATVPLGVSRDDFLRAVRMCHFSRLPVYDGNPRRIVGIVNVYDVLTDAQQQPISVHLREAFRLPADTSVSGALLCMQQAHQAMAIIEEPKGHCLGILTIKDLAEEIVGELEVW